jgi:hypothetical protein
MWVDRQLHHLSLGTTRSWSVDRSYAEAGQHVEQVAHGQLERALLWPGTVRTVA